MYTDSYMAVGAAGVAGCFEFTGYVPYDVLPSLYARMSVFVAPIWKESFGQVAPFAMSMKVPVVGYDVGAIGEIIDNPNLLAAPADAEQLARIAVRLLDSPAERHEVADFQQDRAIQRFSVQAMIGRYSSIYSEITAQVEGRK
ncbi:MAG: glycosyltransferase [Cytophagaceae bacterium]|nr:MAG: glycosyltransferase [Cytophagaceae bacterium]